jgi:hypothetical protein
VDLRELFIESEKIRAVSLFSYEPELEKKKKGKIFHYEILK